MYELIVVKAADELLYVVVCSVLLVREVSILCDLQCEPLVLLYILQVVDTELCSDDGPVRFGDTLPDLRT